MNMLNLVGIASAVVVAVVLTYRKLVVKIVVPESHAGLLYRNGRFRLVLVPGAHRVWRPTASWRILDLRKATVTVSGQEVVSADGVGLKASLAVVYAVADPEKAAHAVQDYANDLYTNVQLALRTIAGGLKIDDLLAAWPEIGRKLLEAAAPGAERIGLKVESVELKDLMFPGDLKKIFAEEVRARKEGLATLEKARAESAALRSLANAARLLEDHPALLSLRLVQTAAAGGNTLMLGVPNGVMPAVRPGAPTTKPDAKASGTEE